METTNKAAAVCMPGLCMALQSYSGSAPTSVRKMWRVHINKEEKKKNGKDGCQEWECNVRVRKEMLVWTKNFEVETKAMLPTIVAVIVMVSALGFWKGRRNGIIV